MKGAGMIVVLLLSLAVGGLEGSMKELQEILKQADCGKPAEVMMRSDERFTFGTRYLMGDDGSINRDCNITWKIAVYNEDGNKKFGVQVSGLSELMHPDAYMTITGSGTTGITSGHNKTGRVSGRFDDVITITLHAVPMMAGRGFSLSIGPIYLCGGEIHEPVGTVTALQAPPPLVGNPALNCVWNVKVEGKNAALECDRFSLSSRNPEDCVDKELLVSPAGYHCGEALKGSKQKQDLTGDASLYYSLPRGQDARALDCKVTL